MEEDAKLLLSIKIKQIHNSNERLKQEHTIKFFVFTERYTPQTGFADETSIHFEIKDGKILNEIKNYDEK